MLQSGRFWSPGCRGRKNFVDRIFAKLLFFVALKQVVGVPAVVGPVAPVFTSVLGQEMEQVMNLVRRTRRGFTLVELLGCYRYYRVACVNPPAGFEQGPRGRQAHPLPLEPAPARHAWNMYAADNKGHFCSSKPRLCTRRIRGGIGPPPATRWTASTTASCGRTSRTMTCISAPTTA